MEKFYDKLIQRVWLRDILSSLAFFLMMLVPDRVLRCVRDGIALTRAAGLTVFLRVPPRLARRIAVGAVSK